MMLRKTLILSLLLSAPAMTAMASETCSVPEADWRPQAELEAELTGKGWTIANIKKEDGCYEVYATDEAGKKVEAFIDPKSFEVVGYDD